MHTRMIASFTTSVVIAAIVFAVTLVPAMASQPPCEDACIIMHRDIEITNYAADQHISDVTGVLQLAPLNPDFVAYQKSPLKTFGTTSVLESAVLIKGGAECNFSERSVALWCVDRSRTYLYDGADDPCNARGNGFSAGEVFKFVAYYGWINCSDINWADSGLTLVIGADDNPGEIQQVRNAGVDVYFYIALGSTYKSTSDKSGWEQGIKNSIDSHNYVNGFFWDEVDPGYYGQNDKTDFNQRLTAINDHAHSKGQKTIANGVRYYANHCESDYYMWESFMSSFAGSIESPDYYYVDFFNRAGSNSDPYQWLNNIDKWEYLQNSSVLNKTLVHCYGDPSDDNKSNYDYIAARVLGVKGFSYVNNNNFASTAVTLAEGMKRNLGTQFDYTVDESNETLSGRFTNDKVEDDVGQTVSTGNAVYFFNEIITPASISSFAPETPVSDETDATRTFNITVDQTVNVTWLINGTIVQDVNTSVTTASYTNTSAALGVWNVSAVVSNANGTVVQTWIWNVVPRVPGDVTGDGVVNIGDAVLLVNWVSFPNERGTMYVLH
ncbi:MAG: hypothetical protein BA871_03270 [Desulfuromonadales bacterium C00003096]|nr:MAG: hypothetical protein BA871_03270 [Desulfuromonadales bacterium C00003096]